MHVHVRLRLIHFAGVMPRERYPKRPGSPAFVRSRIDAAQICSSRARCSSFGSSLGDSQPLVLWFAVS